MTVGEAIRMVREETGVSQPNLADAIGEVQASISRWERGETRPSLDQIAEVERALDVERGTVLRLAGYVFEASTTREAIAGDTALSPGWRRIVLTTYDEAVNATVEERRN